MNNDEMILREYILSQAALIKAEEEDWCWEIIERETFESLYNFMQRKSWIVPSEHLIKEINIYNEYKKSLEADDDVLSDMESDIYSIKVEDIECRKDELQPEAKDIYCFFKMAMGYF